ncbi:MAG: hypothetical protein MUO76_19940 [Anaerolineaceae bacterium]|nr:hypothetical protein [Anaerolineaceae bacterium]
MKFRKLMIVIVCQATSTSPWIEVDRICYTFHIKNQVNYITYHIDTNME